MDNARWLVGHLLEAEAIARRMRSVKHQMLVAKFRVHRDLARFGLEASQVDCNLGMKLTDIEFIDLTLNVVLVGGTSTASVSRSHRPQLR